MSSKELRRRLHAVDPDLTIISGGMRRRIKKKAENWEKSKGEICSQCGKEYFRGRDGMCYSCWEQMKDNEVVFVDKTGITNWLPMEIIEQITHQYRKDM